MIICICSAVSERRIRQAIAEGANTFDDLQFELGVALGCGKCEAAVRDILAEHQHAPPCPRALNALPALTAL